MTIGARDASPRGGGLSHHVLAPQRRRHCNIDKAILFVRSLAASDGSECVSICCCGAVWAWEEADLHCAVVLSSRFFCPSSLCPRGVLVPQIPVPAYIISRPLENPGIPRTFRRDWGFPGFSDSPCFALVEFELRGTQVGASFSFFRAAPRRPLFRQPRASRRLSQPLEEASAAFLSPSSRSAVALLARDGSEFFSNFKIEARGFPGLSPAARKKH